MASPTIAEVVRRDLGSALWANQQNARSAIPAGKKPMNRTAYSKADCVAPNSLMNCEAWLYPGVASPPSSAVSPTQSAEVTAVAKASWRVMLTDFAA